MFEGLMQLEEGAALYSEKGSTAAAANRVAKQVAHTRGRLLHPEGPLLLGHPPACVQKPAADHQACLKGCQPTL